MEFNATFFVSAVSFIIFTIIMNCIFYKPIEKIVNERQKFIDDAYSDAQNSNQKADDLIQDKKYKLAQTDKTTRNIMVEKVTDANKVRDAKIADTKNSARNKINEAKFNLSKEKDDMKEGLNFVTVQLAQIISSKILNENVEISDNELIGRIVK